MKWAGEATMVEPNQRRCVALEIAPTSAEGWGRCCVMDRIVPALAASDDSKRKTEGGTFFSVRRSCGRAKALFWIENASVGDNATQGSTLKTAATSICGVYMDGRGWDYVKWVATVDLSSFISFFFFSVNGKKN